MNGIETRVTVKLAKESGAEKNARVAEALEALSPMTVKDGDTPYTTATIVDMFEALEEYDAIDTADSGVIQSGTTATGTAAAAGTVSSPNGTKGKFTLTITCGTGDDAATATVVINVTPKTYAEAQAAALAAAKEALGENGASITGVTVTDKTNFTKEDAQTAIKSKVTTLVDNGDITVAVTVDSVTKYVAADSGAGTSETPASANNVVITLSIDGADDVTLSMDKIAIGQ